MEVAALQKGLIAISPVLLVLLWQYLRRETIYPRNLPYPPGPKPLPLIGNLRDVPNGSQWLKFATLSQRYGLYPLCDHLCRRHAC